MGWMDRTQSRINFEVSKSNKQQQKSASDSEADSLGGGAGPFTLEVTLLEVQKSLQSIEGSLAAVTHRLDHMSSQVEKQNSRIWEVEQRVSNTEDGLGKGSEKALNMEKVFSLIQAKKEDLEAWPHLNNLRITGLPKSINTGKMETFIESLIKDIFGLENLSNMFIVERAHHSLAARPVPGAPPRPINASLLNYRDRNVILRLAREKGTVEHQGNSLSFFPDFTVAVQAARQEYGTVKKFLQAEGIPYAMLYPAHLRIGSDGESKIFTTPKAAMDHTKKLKCKRREAKAEPEEEEM